MPYLVKTKGKIIKLFLVIILVILSTNAYAQEKPEDYGIGFIRTNKLNIIPVYEKINSDLIGEITVKPHKWGYNEYYYRELSLNESSQMKGGIRSIGYEEPVITVYEKKGEWLRTKLGWSKLASNYKYTSWEIYHKEEIEIVYAPRPLQMYENPDFDSPFSEPVYTSGELHVLEVQGKWMLVIDDENNAYGKGCEEGKYYPVRGNLGWIKFITDEGYPLVINAIPKGC